MWASEKLNDLTKLKYLEVIGDDKQEIPRSLTHKVHSSEIWTEPMNVFYLLGYGNGEQYHLLYLFLNKIYRVGRA